MAFRTSSQSRRDLLWGRGIANQIFRFACLTAAIKNRRLERGRERALPSSRPPSLGPFAPSSLPRGLFSSMLECRKVGGAVLCVGHECLHETPTPDVLLLMREERYGVTRPYTLLIEVELFAVPYTKANNWRDNFRKSSSLKILHEFFVNFFLYGVTIFW